MEANEAKGKLVVVSEGDARGLRGRRIRAELASLDQVGAKAALPPSGGGDPTRGPRSRTLAGPGAAASPGTRCHSWSLTDAQWTDQNKEPAK